jgi:hypothetical protein
MPSINYSNTVIYKIQCQKNPQMCPILGHTTNLKKTQRKMKHNCIHGVSNIHTDIITKNGGFDSWEWIILENFTECYSKYQADNRVEYYKTQFYSQITPNLLTIESKEGILTLENKTVSDKNICEHCSKQFSRKYNLDRHQKLYCKPHKNTQIQSMQTQLEEKDKEIKELKNSMVATTNNINHGTINNINNNTNNNIQNNIIIELGNEDCINMLTPKQRMQILNKRYNSIDALIKYLHCNPKLPQHKCIEIPSLSKAYCKLYSKEHGKFIMQDLHDVLEKLVDHRMSDIQTFLETAQENGENLSEHTETAVKGLIDKLDSDEKYKRKKCSKIKMELHNNSSS